MAVFQLVHEATGEVGAYHDHFGLAGKCFPRVAKRGKDVEQRVPAKGHFYYVGHDARLERISAQYPGDLYGCLRKELAVRGLWGDLAQEATYEVFSRAVERLERAAAEGREVCKTYVNRVVKGLLTNVAVEAGGRARKAERAEGDVSSAAELAAGSAWDAYADGFTEAAFAGLWEAVNDLPEAQRRALLGCAVDGLTVREVGELFGVSHVAVVKALAKARVRLQADERVLSAVDASL
jgi:RNA polymerase sigma factor (sigma-70 family)